MTDRNRELATGRWSRVRERVLTTGPNVEGWYSKHLTGLSAEESSCHEGV